VTENKCLHTVASCWTFINIVSNWLRWLQNWYHNHCH